MIIEFIILLGNRIPLKLVLEGRGGIDGVAFLCTLHDQTHKTGSAIFSIVGEIYARKISLSTNWNVVYIVIL